MYKIAKKIYRLCSENNLLLFKQNRTDKKKIKKKRCDYVDVTGLKHLWQFDLKSMAISME